MSNYSYGKASYGKTQKYEDSRTPIYKLKFGKELKDRTITVRIAPPVKDQESNPHGWYRQINQHYGYGLNIKKKDGTMVFVPQPFKCVRRYGSDGTVVEECAECNEIFRIKAELATKEAELKTQGRTKEVIDSLTKANTDWLKSHNLDKKVYFIAKNNEGIWGYAAITKSLKIVFDEQVNKLVSQGVDPLDPDAGVWFTFTRTQYDGKTDTVAVEEFVQPDGSRRYKMDRMTQNDWEQIEKIASLTAAATSITSEDVRALVQTKGEAAAAIFSRGKASFSARQNPATPPGNTQVPSPAVNEPTPFDDVLTTPTASTTREPGDDTEDEQATAPPTTPANVEEFLKIFNVKGA
jgi:hypothetical protein